MTGYQKKIVISSLILVLGFSLFTACEKEETPKVIVAKVGDRVLTKEKLDSLLAFTANKNKFRNEIINDWVESEILFSEAKKHGIVGSDEYKELINDSNKKLANSIFVNKMLDEFQINLSEENLMGYFYDHKEEFSLSDKAYVFNRVVFTDENKAILFRTTLIESDWSKSSNVFKGDESIKSISENNYVYDYDLPTQKLQIVLRNLNDGETSIIFESEPGLFNIVQLVKSFGVNSIPDYDFVKGLVKARYTAQKQMQYYNEHIRELFSEYDVIINR